MEEPTFRERIEAKLVQEGVRTGVVALETIDRQQIQSLEHGWIFIHAIWSGPSTARLKQLLVQLAKLAHQNFLVYIVDNDGLSVDFCNTVLGELPQGYGEIFVVRGGVVSSKLPRFAPLDVFGFEESLHTPG